jgi:hypothetical protein
MTITRILNLMADVLSLTCCGLLVGNAALAQEPAPKKAARETLTMAARAADQPPTLSALSCFHLQPFQHCISRRILPIPPAPAVLD